MVTPVSAGAGFPRSAPSGEHQHDDRPREVFPQNGRGDHGDPGQEVGAELPANQLGDQPEEKRRAAHDENREKRRARGRGWRRREKSKHEVRHDAGQCDRRDDDGHDAARTAERDACHGSQR